MPDVLSEELKVCVATTSLYDGRTTVTYAVACFVHHRGNYKIMPSGWPVVITEEVAYNLWLICDVCECDCDCVKAKKHCWHFRN